MIKAAAFFISHGAPTFALEPGMLGPNLAEVGRKLSDIKAVLVVSPHWQTRGAIRVMQTAQPETVHDFGGFASELYELQYPAPGAPDVADMAAELLRANGFDVQLDDRRGLDHGAWVPLRYLLPDATLPVFQVSLPASLDTPGAIQLGRALAPLRERGVAIIGSGSMTHNLSEFFNEYRRDVREEDSAQGSGAQYAREFAEWTKDAVLRRDTNALVNYRKLAPHATRAHPTQEHYLPLLVALGTTSPDETISYLEGGLTNGVLSMDSFAWSLADVEVEA